MLDKKTIIALLAFIAICVAIFTGIKVQEFNEKQRVLKEAQEQADREHKAWQRESQKTNEDIRRESGQSTGP